MRFSRAKLDPQFFAALPDPKLRFAAGKIQVQHGANSFSVESLSSLASLLDEMRNQKEHPVLRFLVDEQGKAWFARETRPGIQAPKHYQMTGAHLTEASCITAGNIKFKSTSCKVLKMVNHRSGDFQPSFHSLRLFLAILITNEQQLPFKLPRVLIVKEYNANGSQACRHRWPLSKIRPWALQCIADPKLLPLLNDQKAVRKEVHYEAITHYDAPRPMRSAEPKKKWHRQLLSYFIS